jgi:serine/threonine protein kinase
MDATVQSLAATLARTRLFSEDEARTLAQQGLEETRGSAADFGQFVTWLVKRGHLTEYQGALLNRGHTEGFFLHQYKILERIGRGRMAGVYKAVHALGQTVAIKVLPPSRARNPELWARFRREARLALRLKHPNVVRAYQVGEAAGCHFLVMECLEGETLDEVLLRRGKLQPVEAVRLVHQALLGLQHIHEQGLVHRDLKPANLMLTPAAQPGQPDTTLRATAKILDIGLARTLYDENAPEKEGEVQLTGAGVVLGTPHYMAPEQARDARSADIRADIYSLGCVLYHALAGQPPFPGTSLITQMVRHATEKPRPLKEFNPGIPDGLQQIVDWMLAKDPAQRYPTPERAAQALQIFLAGGDSLMAPETDPRLHTYLQWLDHENVPETAEGDALPAERPRPFPVATPVAPPPMEPAPPRSKSARRSSRSARSERSVAPAPARSEKRPAPVANPPATDAEPLVVTPADSFDVELIPVTEPVETPPGLVGLLPQSRRDFLMIGLGSAGVGGVVVGAGLLYAVVSWLRRAPQPPPDSRD